MYSGHWWRLWDIVAVSGWSQGKIKGGHCETGRRHHGKGRGQWRWAIDNGFSLRYMHALCCNFMIIILMKSWTTGILYNVLGFFCLETEHMKTERARKIVQLLSWFFFKMCTVIWKYVLYLMNKYWNLKKKLSLWSRYGWYTVDLIWSRCGEGLSWSTVSLF